MILLDLLIGFLKVGLFSFGGAYSAIPLIRDVVLSYGWLSEEALTYMIAVSESTPGPIMVNLATYVGSSQAGILGAAVATLAVISPAFVIIILVMAVLRSALDNPYVKAVIQGLAPCVVGVILSIGCTMTLSSCMNGAETGLDIRSVGIAAVLASIVIFYRKVLKKKLSPIALIFIAGILGAVVFGF